MGCPGRLRYRVVMHRSTLVLPALLVLGCDPTPAATDAATPPLDAAPTGEDGASPAEDAASPPFDAGPPLADAGPPMGSTILATVGTTDIALGGGHVYFTTDTMIGRVPIAGGPTEAVYAFSASAPNDIDADDTRIAWTERNASTIWGAVNSCPIGGCGGMPTALPHGAENASEVSLGGDMAYWLSGSVRTVLGAGPGAWSVRSPGLSVADVEVEGGDVFWLDGGVAGTGGAVYRCPASGSCTPTMLSNAVGAPLTLSVSGDHVVVLSRTGVFHMGRDGSAVTRLGDGRTAGYTDIVTDGTRVYWAILESLYGCELASCTPALIDQTTATNDWTSGLELDATHLYWGTRASIRRIDL